MLQLNTQPSHAAGAAQCDVLNVRWKIAVLLLAHVSLALLMRQFSDLATLHAVAVLAIGLWWAINGRLLGVAYASAYIVGAEVLWRMTHASVFWEFGKYSLCFIFLVAALFRKLKPPALPLLYFALLLPSIAINFGNESLATIRAQVSTNLSGPFALLMSIWFFSQLSLSRNQMKTLLFVLVCPITGIAALTLFSTYGASSLSFTNNSNFATSGGFGPNQVSTILSLGALISLLGLVDDRGRGFRILLFGLLLMFVVQSMMTFSRGGAYLAVGSAIVACYFLFRDARWWPTLATTAVILSLLLIVLVIPRLNALTGGALAARFQDTEPTGRIDIMWADYEIWKDNPLVGVGPGRAKTLRAKYFHAVAAHTEFTRMLAEHGMLGAGALVLFALMSVSAFRRPRGTWHNALAGAAVAWSVLFMLVYGMRVAAPAFMFGLAFVSINVRDEFATRAYTP